MKKNNAKRKIYATTVFLYLVGSAVAASAHPQAQQTCGSDIAALKRNIRKLENRLLITTWQVKHLQTHKYFQPFSSTSDSKPEIDKVSDPNQNNNNLNKTMMGTLPPAGSLIVHDKDCSELFDRLRPASGFYRIQPKLHQEPFLVYCDMEDGGGWTVFQRRRHGKVDFNRDWVDYRDGFGDFTLWNDEFWLGNERIHNVLSEGRNLVKIDLMDWNGQRSFAFYENFRITDEAVRERKSKLFFKGATNLPSC